MFTSVVSQVRAHVRKSSRISMAVAAVLGMARASEASDVTWGGTYRIEAIRIANPEMSSDKIDKSYALHHLVLSPKVVAADGLTIFSRLDILNNPNFGITNNGQINSVAGDVLGNGPGTPISGSGATETGPATTNDSNSWGRTERAGTVAVTELYASWAQEFGQLVVGRAPLHFGLGTAFNAGNGLFDHYIDTRDLVAYKIVLGNLYFMPILGKMNRGNIGEESDVNDYILQVQYANPESELSLGFIYDIRNVLANDAPGYVTRDSYWGPANSVVRTGNFKNTLMGFYFSQKALPNLRASVEADLFSGDSGIMYPVNGGGTSINSFGIAAEFAYIPPDESKWGGTFKLGMATGDDPGTTDVYEGYTLNSNYDVAMLMFNHPLGHSGVDFLRTGLTRDIKTIRPSNQIDTEAISNAMYFAPSFTYKSRENLSYGGTFVYALLNKDPIGNGAGTATNLGFEFDFSIIYKPVERLTWITEAGFLVPGEGWRGGANQYENKFVYGIATKAAISF